MAAPTSALAAGRRYGKFAQEMTKYQDFDTLAAARALGLSERETVDMCQLGTAVTVPSTPITPFAPTVVDLTTVTVGFTPTGGTGGAAIDSYTAVSSPGGFTGTSSVGTPITVKGAFVKAQAYTFKVYAHNAMGNSNQSAASTAVTPNP